MQPPFGKRSGFLVRQQEPFNGGPPLAALTSSIETPSDLFFVRNHGGVPGVDPGSFRLEIGGEVERPIALSLPELAARFSRHEIVSTLQCAGNRRQELARWKPIPNELPWGAEAISTARFAGVRLADVIAAARPTARALHAAFQGLDETERHGERFRFGGSIPVGKALAPETLLATEMNGAPLPAVHGFPLRVVVPGWIGARSVKWLHRITLQVEPSANYFQSVAYRLFPADVGPENVVWSEGTMLGELPVNSIVTAPGDGATVVAGEIALTGVALAGNGRSIARVEVSADGGSSWRRATLGDAASRWTWRPWAAELTLGPGRHEIVARAFDDAAQTQPELVEQVWNFKGYANNAWARVGIEVR